MTDTPLLLFRCTLPNGEVQRWSTHDAMVDGEAHEGRVLQHNLFEMRSLGEDGASGVGKLSVRLMDVQGTLGQLERSEGFKGAKLQVRFAFYDLKQGAATTAPVTVFVGTANAPEEMTESAIRLAFVSRMNLQRNYLPSVRIQRRCPWSFPSTAEQRAAALEASDPYGRWRPCGYSADVEGGVGNLNGGAAFTSCDYSRAQCEERGMFSSDAAGRETRRFGGVEFVPASVLVRGFGESGSHTSDAVENEARYNDVVPLVYGTAWYNPPIVFARNDGNLTHVEVLLGSGEIDGVVKVIANGIDVPAGVAGTSMTSTGWYNLVSAGARSGAFNLDFTDALGQPLGDPYGSMAVLSLVLPNKLIQGGRLPKVQVLLRGLKLPTFTESGEAADTVFSNNPAWVLLDILRRSGWQSEELDLGSFARAAAQCAEQVSLLNGDGAAVQTAKFQTNLVVRKRTSVADLVRGIRLGAGLLLAFGPEGRLRLRAESSLAAQQPEKPEGSNGHAALLGGWPAYEFGDGTDGWSDILRRPNGEPSLRFWSRQSSELPNRYTVEFQDELNSFQQDSLSLVDTDDTERAGQEITAGLPAIGIANYRQAAQVVGVQLRRTLGGNLFAEFETSCRGLGLAPGDIITLTYPRLGLSRQTFRVLRLAPGLNFSSVAITAQVHKDEWYTDPIVGAFSGGSQAATFGVGLPRPLLGSVIDDDGHMQWAMRTIGGDDESATVRVEAGFVTPASVVASRLRVPTIGSVPTAQPGGGTLRGGQWLYYAVSGRTSDGVEGPLSTVVRVHLASGNNLQAVQLSGLTFGPGADGFRVYRGGSADALRLVDDVAGTSDSYVDSGAAGELQGPPDFNYDHANFYWRWESLPPTAVQEWSATSVSNAALALSADAYKGEIVRLVSGTGAGQERVIASNTAAGFTVQPAWEVQPDATTTFAVVEASWKLAATTRTSPATWDLPNRGHAAVYVLGRAANVNDQEDDYSSALQTRWRVSTTGGTDQGVARKPIFGLTTQQRGTVDLAAIGFATLDNTDTITSGTLALHFVDEMDPATWHTMESAIGLDEETLTLSGLAASVGNILQIEQELMVVTAVEAGTGLVSVSRGEKGTTATEHAAGTSLYLLKRKIVILSFPKGFFGSPASGDYLQTIDLSSARLAEADLFVTNRFGNSETGNAVYTETVDGGLRTMTGGQFTLQVDGLLGVQDDVALPIVLDRAYAVRDVYALLGQAASATPVVIRLQVDGTEYGTLTIAAGQTVSDVIDGFGRSPLPQEGRLTVDIVSVSNDPGEYPGRDLTVVVRV